MNSKKYILKPGKHQFAPGSPAVHSNDNLSDEEAKWYLNKYPHIASLFAPQPPEEGVFIIKKKKMENKTERKLKEVSTLTPPLGGKGGI